MTSTNRQFSNILQRQNSVARAGSHIPFSYTDVCRGEDFSSPRRIAGSAELPRERVLCGVPRISYPASLHDGDILARYPNRLVRQNSVRRSVLRVIQTFSFGPITDRLLRTNP